MVGVTGDLRRVRSVAVWGAATVAGGGIGWTALPTLAAIPGALRTDAEFAEVLVAGCAVATVAAAAWLWLLTTDVVVGVLRTGGRVAVRHPGRARLLLLSACGAVVLTGPAVPASADDSRPVAPHSLAGLPLPDRATSTATPPHSDGEPAGRVRVRPGDSLWAIAAGRLGPRATDADVVDYWHRIYERNAAVIGPDPDLILPGQLLELPPAG
ncbi:LysM peptidoglycan-binding domain-containing protein [Nocardioides antri]|uniref:LysM domain-containing protein n=1 Tax=Nocardioides antri TaxID=2607659 RepID=A0A5B1LZ67_9ACTN|nr:hypothetical protein [Nocardioides antri]KAA1425754.1 hypothetical protein F0U47_18405 [Nocardioides antri]